VPRVPRVHGVADGTEQDVSPGCRDHRNAVDAASNAGLAVSLGLTGLGRGQRLQQAISTLLARKGTMGDALEAGVERVLDHLR
jgi:hypothetical protein